MCLGARANVVGSNLTAAALHGLLPPGGAIHVTVPYGTSSRSAMAMVHRARLHPVDRTAIDGIPATAIARTLVDLAADLPPVRMRRLVDTAMARTRWLTADGVDAAWDRSQRAPGRAGWSNLHAALAEWRDEMKPGSPAEIRLIRILRQWGYPEPERQVVVRDEGGQVIGRADVGWRPQRLGIEYDSEEWHDRSRWSLDEERHAKIERAGWTLLRADKVDLRPGERSLRDALARQWRAREARAA